MTTPASTRREGLTAAGLYLVLALIWCHQLFLRGFSSTVPNDPGDPLLVTWVLWWNHHVWSTAASWWNPPAFYPAEGVLSFSETFLAISVLTNPLQMFGATPAAAYNTAFVFSFAACAMAAYFLCRECTGDHAAALVGGAYFGFGPHRASHLPQLQILWAFWLPLFFLALFRYRATGRPKYLVFVAIAWIGVACSSVYFLLYGAVAAVLWGIWFLANRHGLRRLATLAVVGVAASFVVAPLFLQFKRWHEYYGLKRSIGEMETYSSDVLSLLDGWYRLWTWPNVPSLDRAEGALYPGLFTFLLLSFAAHQWWRTREPVAGSRRLSLAALGLGGVMFLVGLAAVWTGGARWALGPIGISVSTPYKPMGIGSVALVAAVLLLPRVRASWRRGSVVGWWVLCAASAYIFALGPTGHFAGARFWYKAPYAWLMTLPGFDAARVPARFNTIFALALAVLVACAIQRLATARSRAWLPAAALAGVLVDGAVPIPAEPLPDAVHAEAWGVDMVLEIPLGTYEDVAAMAGSFTHGLPVVNGYSGFAPPHYEVLKSAIKDGRASALDELRPFGTVAVIVDPAREEGGAWPSLLAPFARPDLSAPTGRQVFVLPRLPASTACLARSLDAQRAGPKVTSANATSPGHDPDALGLAIDDDWTTFYTVAASTTAGDGIEIAIDGAQPIDGVILWTGPLATDYPGPMRVSARNGTGLHTVFEGDVAGLVMAGALADPRRVPLAICFPAIDAHGLVIDAPATTERSWSIAEVSVLAP